jgi:hypothetical protein
LGSAAGRIFTTTQEVDACVSFVQIWEESKEKHRVADLMYPIIWDDLSILMPAPTELSKALLIAHPFSYQAS